MIRTDAVMMQQDGHSLPRRAVIPAENCLEVKGQILLSIPFLAVDEGNLLHTDIKQPARRLLLAKENRICQVFIGAPPRLEVCQRDILRGKDMALHDACRELLIARRRSQQDP